MENEWRCSCGSRKFKRLYTVEEYANGKSNMTFAAVICENGHKCNIKDWNEKDACDGN